VIDRIHPSHRKFTLFIISILLIPVLIAFPLGFYFAQIDGGDSSQAFACVITVMIFGTLASSLLIARSFFCICYQCKKLLLKQVKISTDEEKFVCENCQIIWDSKIKMS